MTNPITGVITLTAPFIHGADAPATTAGLIRAPPRRSGRWRRGPDLVVSEGFLLCATAPWIPSRRS